MVKISQVEPELFLHKELAVVGSSSQLKNQKNGPYIDTFTEVVRFNRAPTEGWENHVGSKTTLRVTNNHVFANIKHTVAGEENCPDWKSNGQPQYFIKELRDQKILLINRDSSAWENKSDNLHTSSQGFLCDYESVLKFLYRKTDWNKKQEHIKDGEIMSHARYIPDEYDRNTAWRKNYWNYASHPSVGYAFISLCVMNEIRPTLFGFGIEEKNNKASHYWENKDNITSSHGYNEERNQIKEWHETGKLLIR